MPLTLTMTANSRVLLPTGYPSDTTLSYIATPTVTKPSYATPITDPTCGTKVTRILSDANTDYGHNYAKRQPVSPDGKYALMYHATINSRLILNTSDWSVASSWDGGTSATTINSGSIWGNTLANKDKLLTTGSAPKTVLSWRSINDGALTTIHTFTGWTNLEVGLGEGNLSDDDHYVALQGTLAGGQAQLVYDMVGDTIVAQRSTTVQPNWCGVSHSGSYVVIQFNGTGSGAEQGTWLFDRNLTSIRQITTAGGGHGDFQWDSLGYEVFVYITNGAEATSSGAAIRSHRLTDGTFATVLPSTPACAFRNGHVGGRNILQPGWIIASCYDGTTTELGNDQLAAIKLDSSGTMRVFCQTHHGADVYANDPFGVTDPTGRLAFFRSEWSGSGTQYEYVAQLAL